MLTSCSSLENTMSLLRRLMEIQKFFLPRLQPQTFRLCVCCQIRPCARLTIFGLDPELLAPRSHCRSQRHRLQTKTVRLVIFTHPQKRAHGARLVVALWLVKLMPVCAHTADHVSDPQFLDARAEFVCTLGMGGDGCIGRSRHCAYRTVLLAWKRRQHRNVARE